MSYNAAKISVGIGFAIGAISTGLALLSLGSQSSEDSPVPPLPPLPPIDKKGFVARLLPIAVRLEKEYGLDRRILIAQAALESGWGRRTPGNMLFGVKWTTAYPLERRQLLQTWEAVADPSYWRTGGRQVVRQQKRAGVSGWVVRDWFLRYDSWEHCLDEHVAFLARRWPGAFRVQPETAARILAGANGGPRYATDPNYAQSLISIVSWLNAEWNWAGV